MPDDDFKLQSYQDDLTTDDDATDPVMEEEGEDPSEELGVPPEELRKELDKEFDDEDEINDDNVDVHDDERESVEDADEDPDNNDY